jgi:hypothetical protein
VFRVRRDEDNAGVLALRDVLVNDAAGADANFDDVGEDEQ